MQWGIRATARSMLTVLLQLLATIVLEVTAIQLPLRVLMVQVSTTVIHSGAGDQTPADNVQTATWSRTVTVDNVTGEVLSTTDWTVNKTTYDAVTTPVITGYYADTAEVAAQTVTQEDLETTVVYKELGKVIPVDPNGNPIPDAPTPQYKNDRYYIKYLQYPTL